MPQPEPVRPDYGGAWIGAIVPALLGGHDDAILPAAAREARAVVLLVLDGLGWNALQRHAAGVPQLAGMVGGPITTVVPSTTAAALTSLSTGVPPAEHGLVGYRMRIAAQVLNVLRWEVPHRGRPPEPERVQPVLPFLGHRVPVVAPSQFRETGFSGAYLRGTALHGWVTTAVLVEACRRLVAAGEEFVYAYYDGIDKVAHAHGITDSWFDAELASTDALVGALLDVLPPDVALVVTADHGQVQVPPAAVVRLDPLAAMVSAYAGESRFRSLHARSGASRELQDAARERYADVAWVRPREQLFDEGWLGTRARAEVRGRVGDVVLAPFAPVAFADPTYSQEDQLLGRHGSLTADEMLVPLIAAYGRSATRPAPA